MAKLGTMAVATAIAGGARLYGYDPSETNPINRSKAYLISDITGTVAYPQLVGEPTVFDTRYAPGNVKRYGAIGDGIIDDTVALQAAFDYCATSHVAYTPRPKVYLPAGLYRITANLRIKQTRIDVVGDSQYQSIISYNGVAAGCIVYDALAQANPHFADFSIVGDATSGRGIDLSAPAGYTYNGAFERMQIYAGQEAIYGPQVFSFKFDGIYGESLTKNIFQVRCGPSVSWINCYAGRCLLNKAGYRLAGSIRMYSCNGVNSGGYWGVFGSKNAAVDGWQNDFPGLADDYPDIELHGCNVEAWTVTGLWAVNAYQKFKMSGGGFSRALAGTYHSAIRSTVGSLNGNGGSIVLDSVRALFSGGAVTAAQVYADANDALTLINDNTTFTGIYSAAFALTYPPIKESVVPNTFNEVAKSVSSLTSRRLSADILRFNDTTLAAGTTVIDSTGKTLVRTANVAPTTILSAAYTQVIGTGADAARNGFLIIQVEDTFTTIAHNSGTSGQFQLLGGKDYAATKGDVLVFVVSEFDTAVLHRGWVQISGTRSQSIRDSFAQAYSAAITIDNAKGEEAIITVTNGVAFTINAPTNSIQDRKLLVTLRNTSGGAMGAITMNAIFHSAGALVAPATGFQRTYAYKWNGASYQELWRTPADVAN